MRGLIAAILLVAGGCSQAEKPETGDAEPASPFATDGIAAVSTGDVPENQLIICSLANYDGQDGITITQPFVILDGAIKRYSEFENTAFDLCQPGQDGCALGWKGDDIAMVYTAPSGAVTATTVDLEAMAITEQSAKAGADIRTIKADATCTSSPLPTDLKTTGAGDTQ